MRAARAEINLSALRFNLEKLHQMAPLAKLLAIVKADAYGHGLEDVVQSLSTAATPADAFGVASIDDALRIRAIDANSRIVLLSGFDEEADFPIIHQYQIDCVVHDVSQLDLLENSRLPAGFKLRVWLKIDTGMRRLGFLPTDAKSALQRLQRLACVDPNITLMSHFSQADEIGLPDALDPAALSRCNAQVDAFLSTRATLTERQLDLSLSNSGATLSLARAHQSWVRPGGLLYGLSTHDTLTGADLGFKPVMRLSTRLIATKQVAKGDFVGYGNSFQATRDMRIGIAAIGYGDGYPRHAPSGTPVTVNGVRSKTVGRVSMDLLAIDLTELDHVQAGAEVVLWGPELPIETIARAAGTISYELSCGITKRVRFELRLDQ